MTDTPRGSMASAPSDGGVTGNSAAPREPITGGARDFASKAVLAKYHTTGQLNIYAAHNRDPPAVLAVTYQYGTDGHRWALGEELRIVADLERLFCFSVRLSFRRFCSLRAAFSRFLSLRLASSFFFDIIYMYDTLFIVWRSYLTCVGRGGLI